MTSFAWKHTEEAHNGVIGLSDYKINPIEKFQESMTRILSEAIIILKNESDVKTKSLNSKIEFYGP